MYEGVFGNNILIFNVNKEERIHCFYFIDNNELRQGYIQIYRSFLEKKMIEELKTITPFEFFKKYNIKYDNEGLQLFSYYEVIIYNLEKNENNNTKEIEINHEEIVDDIKNNIEEITKEIKEKKKKKKKHSLIAKLADFFPSKSNDKVVPGIKGLKNIGATCYMNATLQCFSNIDKIKTELINKYLKVKDKELTFALAEVIYNLWEKLDERKYSPKHFKEIISKKILYSKV